MVEVAGAAEQNVLPRPAGMRLGRAPQLRVEGYCAQCGTWDSHVITCVACGYDFGGASQPIQYGEED